MICKKLSIFGIGIGVCRLNLCLLYIPIMNLVLSCLLVYVVNAMRTGKCQMNITRPSVINNEKTGPRIGDKAGGGGRKANRKRQQSHTRVF